MPAAVWFLGHKLGTSVFTAKENAAAVDVHHIVPSRFSHLVHGAVMLGPTYTSIVDHPTS